MFLAPCCQAYRPSGSSLAAWKETLHCCCCCCRCWSLGSWRVGCLTHPRTPPSCLWAGTSFSKRELGESSYHHPVRGRDGGKEKKKKLVSHSHWTCSCFRRRSPLLSSCRCRWPEDCCIHAPEWLWPKGEKEGGRQAPTVSTCVFLLAECVVFQ